jgi:hypothetical protein
MMSGVSFSFLCRRRGGNGRRTGLSIRRAQGRRQPLERSPGCSCGFKSHRLHAIRFALRVFLLIALLVPTSASATIHGGGVSLEEPTAEGTLGPPEAPPVEQGIYLHSVSAAYEDQAGNFTITVEAFDPAHWGPQFGTLFFKATENCAEQSGLRGRLGSGTEGSTGEVSLSGINGELTSPGAFNGLSTTFTFQSQYFKGQEWHCVTLSPSGVYGYENPNGGSFSLGDYPPPEVPLPRLVCFSGHYYEGHLRPHSCLIFRPGSSNSETFDLTHLRWTRWSATRATATGYDLGAHPGMIGSKPYRVRLALSRPGKNPTTGEAMFTRVTEYSAAHPNGYTVRPY